MKTSISFLFALCCSLLLKAQDYQPMVLEGAHWFRYSFDCDHGDFEQTYQKSWGFAIKGDTTIMGIDYKKIYQQDYIRELEEDCSSNHPMAPYFMTDEQIFGFVREDITERKVYAILNENILNCAANEEQLWYDFSLNIGDTLQNCFWEEYVLSSISTTGYYGAVRRIFTFEDYDSYVFLMEGIGGPRGIFSCIFCIHVGAPIGTIMTNYCLGTDEECGIQFVNSVAEINLNNQLEIIPNPAQNEVRIQFEQPTKTAINLQLINQIGESVQVQHIMENTEEVHINLEGLPKGFYYLYFQTAEGAFSRKIIKE